MPVTREGCFTPARNHLRVLRALLPADERPQAHAMSAARREPGDARRSRA